VPLYIPLTPESQKRVQSNEWKDDRAAEEMTELLRIRGGVLSLLEQARRHKYVPIFVFRNIRDVHFADI
jgi:hypothetical protein